MAIIVACQCGLQFRAQQDLAGSRVQCPSCGGPLTVPAQAVSRPTASPTSASSLGPIIVSCLCGGSFKAKASMAGTRAACPACGRPLDIPSASATSDDPLFSDDINDLMSQSMRAPTLGTQSTVLPRPSGYAQDTDVSDVLRSALKRVSLGMSSFGIAILAGLVDLILMVSLRDTARAEFERNTSLAFTVGLTFLIMLAACLTGTVLGAVSIKHDGRDRVLAYLGMVFNVLIILFFGCCGVASALFTLQ